VVLVPGAGPTGLNADGTALRNTAGSIE